MQPLRKRLLFARAGKIIKQMPRASAFSFGER